MNHEKLPQTHGCCLSLQSFFVYSKEPNFLSRIGMHLAHQIKSNDSFFCVHSRSLQITKRISVVRPGSKHFFSFHTPPLSLYLLICVIPASLRLLLTVSLLFPFCHLVPVTHFDSITISNNGFIAYATSDVDRTETQETEPDNLLSQRMDLSHEFSWQAYIWPPTHLVGVFVWMYLPLKCCSNSEAWTDWNSQRMKHAGMIVNMFYFKCDFLVLHCYCHFVFPSRSGKREREEKERKREKRNGREKEWEKEIESLRARYMYTHTHSHKATVVGLTLYNNNEEKNQQDAGWKLSHKL